MRLLASLFVALSIALTGVPVLAADLGAGVASAPVTAPHDATDYLRRHAVLLMIRSTFDVLPHDRLEDELASEVRRLGPDGPSDVDVARLDRNLLLEGGYYLVSLRYLIEVGGAMWPGDRPESNYANDALVTLDALERQLVDAIDAGLDPLPVFEEAQRLLTLTEGITEPGPANDRFLGRDAMVDRALEQYGPRSST